jgi:hypothetical protein
VKSILAVIVTVARHAQEVMFCGVVIHKSITSNLIY